jgi:hypothetical protein
MIKPVFLLSLLLCASAAFAVNALVTDVEGRDYNVLSVKLAKGSKLKVVCGETRMEVPFKSVKSMKIAPTRISSVDGQLYFGVEIRTGDGAVIGSLDGGGGGCAVCAGNGIVGKTASKSKYSSPLSNVSAVSILGKGEEKKGGEEDEEDSEE